MTSSDKTRKLEAYGAGYISIHEVSEQKDALPRTPAARRQELEFRAAQLQLTSELTGAMATESAIRESEHGTIQ